MTKEEILEILKQIIEKNFEIEPDKVSVESNIVQDLDLDSIDATDMVVELQRRLQCRFTHEDFKAVKTVGDIVNIVASKIENADK
jgi:acyl carrier protein